MAVPMTISAAMADLAAGDIFAARADLCHQYSLFFPGVVDTGQK
jgi:hypothetical protein